MSQPTNILYLPVVELLIDTTNNSDWLDGIEYWDDVPPAGNPIDLKGIEFALEMRTSPANRSICRTRVRHEPV